MRPRRLRTFLAWFCSEATLTRIVDPVVSDMTIETQRRAWRGYFDLVRALALHTVTSVPTLTADLIKGDGRALPRALAWSFVVAGLATVPFLTIPALGAIRNAFSLHVGVLPKTVATAGALLLLGPQALVVTLPPAWLIAGARVLPGLGRKRRISVAVAVALMATAATAVLVAGVVPSTNQAYRVFVSGKEVSRGRGEYSVGQIRSEAERLRRTLPNDPAYAARIRLANGVTYEYQTRIALMLSPLALAVLSLAMASTRAVRRRPLLTGTLAFSTYIVLMLTWFGGARSLPYSAVIPPSLLAWIPNLAVLTIAVLLYSRQSPRRRHDDLHLDSRFRIRD